MLVLSRRCGEEIVIGGNIRVTVLSVKGGQVRLGVSAPRSVTVDRQEIHARRVEQEGEELCSLVVNTPSDDAFWSSRK